MTPYEVVYRYHERTKHHPDRYARSLGYLDWANQPNPFRRFEGTPLIELPLLEQDDTSAYETLFLPGAVPPRPLHIRSVALLFECSLAISAWKAYKGERWALRCNPSSGNLHPTEGYLIAGPVAGLGDSPGVYHYAPREHGLERRCEFALETWRELTAGFAGEVVLVGLTSIPWREAWKYGERAFRYCQHDVGHAIAAVRIAAAMLGWRAIHLDGVSDDAVARLLGVDRANEFHESEREHPEVLIAVFSGAAEIPRTLPVQAIRAVARARWFGKANRLSAEHVDWIIIDEVAKATRKPETAIETRPAMLPDPSRHHGTVSCGESAYRIIQQRRSAVALDGRTGISRDCFYRILARTMPHPGAVPWDCVNWPVCAHLALFVHRVGGIPPGLYCLARDPMAMETLHAAMKRRFTWEAPEGCPATLPLRLLQAARCDQAATVVCCHQDIAGDGAFSLGMIVDFRASIERYGPWHYRRLFWETGMIGQVLYLEAEAAGIRATGIGCFFDDVMHDLFGLRGDPFQSLYHFTMGGPIEDRRLTTLPSYERRSARI